MGVSAPAAARTKAAALPRPAQPARHRRPRRRPAPSTQRACCPFTPTAPPLPRHTCAPAALHPATCAQGGNRPKAFQAVFAGNASKTAAFLIVHCPRPLPAPCPPVGMACPARAAVRHARWRRTKAAASPGHGKAFGPSSQAEPQTSLSFLNCEGRRCTGADGLRRAFTAAPARCPAGGKAALRQPCAGRFSAAWLPCPCRTPPWPGGAGRSLRIGLAGLGGVAWPAAFIPIRCAGGGRGGRRWGSLPPAGPRPVRCLSRPRGGLPRDGLPGRVEVGGAPRRQGFRAVFAGPVSNFALFLNCEDYGRSCRCGAVALWRCGVGGDAVTRAAATAGQRQGPAPGIALACALPSAAPGQGGGGKRQPCGLGGGAAGPFQPRHWGCRRQRAGPCWASPFAPLSAQCLLARCLPRPCGGLPRGGLPGWVEVGGGPRRQGFRAVFAGPVSNFALFFELRGLWAGLAVHRSPFTVHRLPRRGDAVTGRGRQGLPVPEPCLWRGHGCSVGWARRWPVPANARCAACRLPWRGGRGGGGCAPFRGWAAGRCCQLHGPGRWPRQGGGPLPLAGRWRAAGGWGAVPVR